MKCSEKPKETELIGKKEEKMALQWSNPGPSKWNNK
jgi:hypothetical protein